MSVNMLCFTEFIVAPQILALCMEPPQDLERSVVYCGIGVYLYYYSTAAFDFYSMAIYLQAMLTAVVATDGIAIRL